MQGNRTDDRGGAVIDLRTREVVFPPVEPRRPELDVLTDLHAAFERAGSQLDPGTTWGDAVRASEEAVRNYLSRRGSGWEARDRAVREKMEREKQIVSGEDGIAHLLIDSTTFGALRREGLLRVPQVEERLRAGDLHYLPYIGPKRVADVRRALELYRQEQS